MPVDLSLFEIIDANIRKLEIDEIKQMLTPLMVGYSVQNPIFDPGMFLYRARKLGPNFRKVDGITCGQLIYPPKESAPLGRVNRVGDSVFYSSLHKASVFFELQDLNVGDEIVLTFWKTTELMFVNNIGYTEFAFAQLGAGRPLPTWQPKSSLQPGSTEETVGLSRIPPEVIGQALSHDDNREVKEAFSRYFAQKFSSNDSFRYKLTVALAEMHRGTIVTKNTQFAGLLYPSVQMSANGDNLALLPWFVDRHLQFRKAVHVQIKGRTATTFDVDYLDAAHGFDASGKLAWLGRIRAWSLKPQQGAKFQVVSGRDHDGDFMIAKDGTPCHWVAEDLATGVTLEMG